MTYAAGAEDGRTEDRTILAIDVGKSKCLVGLFVGTRRLEDHRIAVTTADETVAALEARVADVFDRHRVGGIGLSVFGPVETDPAQPDFGAIVASSEQQWSGVNLPAILSSRYGVSVRFDYDVNAAVLAEARDREPGPAGFVYLSIGTGVGGAFHHPQEGISPRTDPPQLGHISLPREPDDPYPGSCRFHGDCFQGLASGRALFGRWGMPAHELPEDHEAWDLEARYIGRACADLLYSTPHATVRVGSGIARVPGLVARSNYYLRAFMAEFPATLWRRIGERDVIELAATAPESSLIGAAVLAGEEIGLEFAPGGAARSSGLRGHRPAERAQCHGGLDQVAEL